MVLLVKTFVGLGNKSKKMFFLALIRFSHSTLKIFVCLFAYFLSFSERTSKHLLLLSLRAGHGNGDQLFLCALDLSL